MVVWPQNLLADESRQLHRLKTNNVLCSMYVLQFCLFWTYTNFNKVVQKFSGRICIALSKPNLTRLKRPRFIYLFAGLVPQHGARVPETHLGGSSLHDRRFMRQAGRTRYFARSATLARSARLGEEKIWKVQLINITRAHSKVYIVKRMKPRVKSERIEEQRKKKNKSKIE